MQPNDDRTRKLKGLLLFLRSLSPITARPGMPHVCSSMCVCKDVCVYTSLRERERETLRYILFERKLQALL